MKCPSCGKLSVVHVGNQTDVGWLYSHYCDDCLSFHGRDERRVCWKCGHKLADFLRKGHLGCDTCYDSFSPELVPLMDRHFRKPRFETEHRINPPIVSGIARARSITISEIINDPWKRDRVEENGGRFSVNHPQLSVSLPDLSHFTGGNDEILISTRIRAARNIPNIPFLPDSLDPRVSILNDLTLGAGSSIIQQLSNRFQNQNWEKHEMIRGRAGTEEIHQLSRAGILPEIVTDAAWFCPNSDRLVVIYGGDEDHIRIQWIIRQENGERGASNISASFEDLRFFDNLMEWQFSPQFGFLASCPSNSGTGVRISFLLDLRGLILSGGWDDWRDSLKGMGLDVRGERGEGSEEVRRIQVSAARFPYGENLEKGMQNLLIIIKRLIKAEKNIRKSKGIPFADN